MMWPRWTAAFLCLLLLVFYPNPTFSAPAVPSECAQGKLSLSGDLVVGLLQTLLDLLGLLPKPCAPSGVSSSLSVGVLLEATLEVTSNLARINTPISVSGLYLAADSAARSVAITSSVDLDGCASCSLVYGPSSTMLVGNSGSIFAANGFSVVNGGTLRLGGVLGGASVRGDTAYPKQNAPINILPSARFIADTTGAVVRNGAFISVRGGEFAVLASSNLLIESSRLDIQSGSTAVISGALQLSSSALTLNATSLAVASGGAFSVLTNSQLLAPQMAEIYLDTVSSFNVAAGARLNASQARVALYGTSSSVLTINGTLSAATLLLKTGSAVVRGLVEAASSTLENASLRVLGAISSPTLQLISAATQISGSVLSNNISLTNAASLDVLVGGRVESAILNVPAENLLRIAGSVSLSQLLAVSGGNLDLNGLLQAPTANLLSGSAQAIGGNLTLSGLLSMTQGSLFNASNTIISASEIAAASAARLIGKAGSAISTVGSLVLTANSSALLQQGSLMNIGASISLSDRSTLVVDALSRATSVSVEVDLESLVALNDDSVMRTVSTVVKGGSKLLVGLTSEVVSSSIFQTLSGSVVELAGSLLTPILDSSASQLLAQSSSLLELDELNVNGGMIVLGGTTTVNSSVYLTNSAFLRVDGSLSSRNASARIRVENSRLTVSPLGSVRFGSILARGASTTINIAGSAVFSRVANFEASSTVDVSGSLQADTSVAISGRTFSLSSTGLLKSSTIQVLSGATRLDGRIESSSMSIAAPVSFSSISSAPTQATIDRITIGNNGRAKGHARAPQSEVTNSGVIGEAPSGSSTPTITSLDVSRFEQTPEGRTTTTYDRSASSTTIRSQSAVVSGTLTVLVTDQPSQGASFDLITCSDTCAGSFQTVAVSSATDGLDQSCQWRQSATPKSISMLFVGSTGCSNEIGGNTASADDSWRNIVSIVVPVALIALCAIVLAVIMMNPALRVKVLPFLIRRNPAKYAKYAGVDPASTPRRDTLDE